MKFWISLWSSMSDNSCLMADVRCLMFKVRCPMSDVWCPMSDVWNPVSDVWCLIFDYHVWCLKSFLSQTTHLFQCFLCFKGMTKEYSLTSPYGHLYNTDASEKRTLGSFPLVSILKDVWLYNIGKQHRYEDVIFDKIHQTLDIEHHPSDIRQQARDIRH